jgi:hypothetical protein
LVGSNNIDDDKDRIILHPWDRPNHTFLMVMQATDTGSLVFAIDSAPRTLTKTEREEVHTEFLANDAGKTGYVSWVFGPQQTGLDQEGYFVV